MRISVHRRNYGAWLASASECRNVVFHALDLTADDRRLAALPQAMSSVEGCLFLGCVLGPELARTAGSHHALVFPSLPDVPFKAFRDALYTVEELFDGFQPEDVTSYRRTMDWRTYESYVRVGADDKPLKPVQLVPCGLDELLARRLHDFFVDEGLRQFLSGLRGTGRKGVVAIMGGHDRKRSEPGYQRIAALARTLTQDGYLVASGGGPGFMEAANLGAFFAARSEGELSTAIAAMATEADDFRNERWLRAAWNVRERYRPASWDGCRSLGIPTWFYGHEPPNVFASHIAKYFENSTREEGLLAIATHGVVFAEGNGGTIQEIFQDACQNYYVNYGVASPMILLGDEYWNPKALRLEADHPVYPEKVYPAWPLLEGLAERGGFSGLVTLASSAEQVLESIRSFPAPG